MELIFGIPPPSRETWEWVVFIFQLFPIVTLVQWAQLAGVLPQWYAMGKTSTESKYNIPGKIGWMTMEAPGFLTVLYIMFTLPDKLGITLERDAWIMAGLYCIHYVYRSIISPLLNPSMSPIHPLIWLSAFTFQVMNGISIGGWLAGYGNVTRADWSDHHPGQWAAGRMELGLMLMGASFLFNIFHDNELREIRWAKQRIEARRAKEADKSTGKDKNSQGKVGVDKFYMIPQNGGFWVIFYPHYVSEWFEWLGYCFMGGSRFVPGRIFLVNEIATMLPRAIEGRNWYIRRFGAEKVAGRKAVIPFVL